MASTIAVPCLVGAKVEKVRPATLEELEDMGMDEPNLTVNSAMVLILDNGVKVTSWCDPEGNGPGHMVGIFRKKVFDVTKE